MLVLGEEYGAHAARAEMTQQLVVAEEESLMTPLQQFLGLPFRDQADALQVFDEALAVGLRRIDGSRRAALTGRGEFRFEVGERLGDDRGLEQAAFLHKLQIFVAG